MNKSQTIIAFALFLFCSSVICEKPETSYTLQVEWPVRASYFGEKYNKQDFPIFEGDNFVIKSFFSSDDNSSGCFPNYCPESQQIPFNPSDINESDSEYLKKYFYRFGLDNDYSTQDLWNESGVCYKKSQTQYFSDMVSVHQKYNIVQALQAKGIYPSKTRIYTVDEFSEALSAFITGDRISFYCGMQNDFGEEGQVKAPILRYFNLFLDQQFNPSKEINRLCTYEYCSKFYYLPLEF